MLIIFTVVLQEGGGAFLHVDAPEASVRTQTPIINPPFTPIVALICAATSKVNPQASVKASEPANNDDPDVNKQKYREAQMRHGKNKGKIGVPIR